MLGNVPLTTEEMPEDRGASSAWGWFGLQAYLQWRWDHEHEAVLREDAEKELESKRTQVVVTPATANPDDPLKIDIHLNTVRFKAPRS